MTRLLRLTLGGALFLAAILGLLCWAGVVAAHEAASGFSYSPACCSNRDCRPAEPGEVTFTPGGWYVATTGETIPMNAREVKVSGDSRIHLCLMETSVDFAPQTKTRCLYIPEPRI